MGAAFSVSFVAQIASLVSYVGAQIVTVKNIFLNVEDSTDVRRPRRKTMPREFWSQLQMRGGSDVSTDADASDVEADAASCSSSSAHPSLSLLGRVWALSQDARGCREVQEALGDESLSETQREAIAAELRGHVLEAAVCPHANFVLQKCIVALKPEAVQFIVSEIPSHSVTSLAQSRYGCRILQRLFERCHRSQVHALVESVLADIVAIAQSPYGNYVVQNLLDSPGADAEQRCRLVQLLRDAVGELGLHPSGFGCIVISAALTKCRTESRKAILRAVLEEPGLLGSMARKRHGHKTVLAALDVAEEAEFERARRILGADAGLSTNKFVRAVAARLGQE